MSGPTISPREDVWLRPEFQGRRDELIMLSEGARMVGVTRAAVSNWAARHRGFPRIALLSGTPAHRLKYVPRQEFLAFAQRQLAKTRGPNTAARTAETRRIAQCEQRVQRLRGMEASQAAALRRTRESLRNARARLYLEKARAAKLATRKEME